MDKISLKAIRDSTKRIVLEELKEEFKDQKHDEFLDDWVYGWNSAIDFIIEECIDRRLAELNKGSR